MVIRFHGISHIMYGLITIPPLWTILAIRLSHVSRDESFAQLRDATPLRGVKKKEDVLSASS